MRGILIMADHRKIFVKIINDYFGLLFTRFSGKIRILLSYFLAPSQTWFPVILLKMVQTSFKSRLGFITSNVCTMVITLNLRSF